MSAFWRWFGYNDEAPPLRSRPLSPPRSPTPPPPPPPPPTLLDEPWRESEGWDENVRRKLLDEVVSLAPETRGKLKVPFFNIFLTGQIGAGKSSFYNSVNSILLERVLSRAGVGKSAKSLTSEFFIYEVRTSSSSPPLSWRICDTMGLTHKRLDENTDIRNILKAIGGHVPNGYEFEETKEFDDDNKRYIRDPSEADKAHCVGIVVDASQITTMQSAMWEKLQTLRRKLIDKKIPAFILLTKIDEACPKVAEDVTDVFRSIQIENIVQSVSMKLQGLPGNQVFPVKNYSKEMNLKKEIDILVLYALRQMLYAAQGNLENKLDSIQMLNAAQGNLENKLDSIPEQSCVLL